MRIANSSQIQEADRQMIEQYAYPSILLMEAAAQGTFQATMETFADKERFLILAGTGNNGGDGMAVARMLHRIGKKVLVILPSQKRSLKGDPQIQLQILQKMRVPIEYFDSINKTQLQQEWLEQGAVLIDALLGTGLNTYIKEPYISIIDFFRPYASNGVVAVDLPSGLIPSTGSLVNEPLPATITVTFQLPKICHYVYPAAAYCGKVIVVDIGIHQEIIDRLGIRVHLLQERHLAQWRLQRPEDFHKNRAGHAIVCGGSPGKSGAIALAAKAALYCGAGLVTAFIPGNIATQVHASCDEVMTIPYGSQNTYHLNASAAELLLQESQNKQAILIGPGLTTTPDARSFLEAFLPENQLPLVLDADALNLLAENPDWWQYLSENTILTPHPGEMARLLRVESAQKVQERRFEYATHLAEDKGVIVVLKGKGTIIASPKGTVAICDRGNPGMSKAGMGDVLAGMIVSFLAQGYTPFRSAAIAVFLHAYTGDELIKKHGLLGLMPTHIIENAAHYFDAIAQNPKSIPIQSPAPSRTNPLITIVG